MRVIAGEFRSRLLVAPPGTKTRPTPDRLRETLFNILQLELEGVEFCDLYAGSGSVGIEALSRGVRFGCFVEADKAALTALKQNLKELGLEKRGAVHALRVREFLRQPLRGIVFLDPPYDQPSEYEPVLTLLGRTPPQVVVAQHDRKLELAERYGAMERTRQVKQGDNILSFYRPLAEKQE
jgi:16S rRNA (guanine966-N2)-methyltransferase